MCQGGGSARVDSGSGQGLRGSQVLNRDERGMPLESCGERSMTNSALSPCRISVSDDVHWLFGSMAPHVIVVRHTIRSILQSIRPRLCSELTRRDGRKPLPSRTFSRRITPVPKVLLAKAPGNSPPGRPTTLPLLETSQGMIQHSIPDWQSTYTAEAAGLQ